MSGDVFAYDALMRAVAQAKRLVRIVVGFTLLIVGIAALVLPGPGWLTIALALTILATEFVWAKRLLDRLKTGAGKIGRAVGVGKRRE